MGTLSPELREYFTSNETLARQAVFERHPGLKQRIAEPATRAQLIAWLSTDDAWQDTQVGLVVHCLEFLRPQASASEAPVVSTFLLHESPDVRMRAYEHLLTQYFPDKNPSAMAMLFQAMLLDREDRVRALGVRYIQRASRVDDLRPLLTRWLKLAPARGWNDGESAELIRGVLSPAH